MRKLLKSSFLWQFTGGFVIGAIGVFAMQPASASQHVTTPAASAIHAVR